MGTFFSYSKLTLYTESCFELSESCEWLQALLKILSQYEKKQVRKVIFFTLQCVFSFLTFFYWTGGSVILKDRILLNILFLCFFLWTFFFLQELVVRVCFILGNLTSKSEKVRKVIFSDQSFMDVLVSVMQTYFNLELEVSSHDKIIF